MGQKVHPLGFRVGITKKHQSQWFARFNKNKYAQSVLEDRMLRQTLTNLFPQLLNPVLLRNKNSSVSAGKYKNDEISAVPKITQIKIERGLIPYEIGIQIHAENCDLIKKSIENLKVNRDLLCHLQKTRRYLQHLQLKLNDFSTSSSNTLAQAKATDSQQTESLHKEEQEREQLKAKNTNKSEKRAFGGTKSHSQKRGREQGTKVGRFRARLTKQQFRRKRLILKRLKKRQSIRRRYKQLVYKGLFLTKKGNKVVQKFQTSAILGSLFLTSKMLLPNTVGVRSRKNKAFAGAKASNSLLDIKDVKQKGRAGAMFVRSEKSKATLLGSAQSNGTTSNNSANIFKSRIKKKFVSVFINRMSDKFLQALKNTFVSSLYIKNSSLATTKTLGWSKKWDFNSVQKQLAQKPLSQLTKLSTVLEQKSLKKMESLRKDFIASGLISKTDALNYYQMLFFLKQLKENKNYKLL